MNLYFNEKMYWKCCVKLLDLVLLLPRWRRLWRLWMWRSYPTAQLSLSGREPCSSSSRLDKDLYLYSPSLCCCPALTTGPLHHHLYHAVPQPVVLVPPPPPPTGPQVWRVLKVRKHLCTVNYQWVPPKSGLCNTSSGGAMDGPTTIIYASSTIHPATQYRRSRHSNELYTWISIGCMYLYYYYYYYEIRVYKGISYWGLGYNDCWFIWCIYLWYIITVVLYISLRGNIISSIKINKY